MKVYAGAPAPARQYVECDRARVDDYYLAEGTAVARRFGATDGRVAELAPLTGQAYESWVAGRDPETDAPRGVLRQDAHAVRFVEVVVNGPKTWSIAAALHSDVAQAYEAAQDRAAGQILGWLSQHATTRVGARGGQVAVPVQLLEAATVRHHTSRAGDPHWHLHLQFLSRVYAAGKWRGLWTLDVRDSLAAINGIGHAAMDTDPEFNAALAAYGYTKDATGEILELAEYVGPLSARTAQIARNADRYEREWAAAHPGERPGPALRRAWDARAWAEGRPDKVIPQRGTDLTERWRTELQELGYRAPARPVALRPSPVGALDRDDLAERALTRLAAARSAWNAADVRGEAERLIAAAGVVAESAVRLELAEDLTARAMRECVPLLDRDGMPEHIRAWTSAPVLAVEADLTTRLAARATGRPVGCPEADLAPPQADLTPPVGPAVDVADVAGRLDPGQAAAVAALAGDRALVVIEGAAGVGKTTTLAAATTVLEPQGRRLVVVTPTLKAARVAAAEVGAAAGSAARLAYEYGWRWDDDGTWTRLTIGDPDPLTGRIYAGPAEAARLRPGDLLVIDEAGMLGQDTARALLTLADECRVRVALLGDRHQLPAVGRGGVLDLAAAQVDAEGHLSLEGVRRFVRADAAGRLLHDTDYADLTLAMRSGDGPGAVFDALLARGQIRLHSDDEALREALAATAADALRRGEQVAVVADTREQVAELNAAIRQALVAAGRVDDTVTVSGRAGQPIGVGDRVVTRRNDRDLEVANRDVWLVTALTRDGGLRVTPAVTPAGNGAGRDAGGIPGGVTSAVGQRLLPAGYVAAHVELGYASTVHGAQGQTLNTSHVVVGESTGAAAAYVGMTRGRQANIAHLVAADPDEARDQWIAVFGRDRADLGPAHAAQLAAAEAARYAEPRPLEQVLAELREARTAEQRCLTRLAVTELRRDALAELVALGPGPAERLPELSARDRRAHHDAWAAQERADAGAAAVAADAAHIREELLAAWDAQRGDAAAAARVIAQGPGRFGRHRGAVIRAGEQLQRWADTWRPQLPDLPAEPRQIGQVAGWFDDRPALWAAFDAAAAQAARATAEATGRALADARREDAVRVARFGALADTADPAARLADADRDLTAIHAELTAARERIARLTAEPAYRAQPADQQIDQPVGRRARTYPERHHQRPAATAPASPDRGIRSPRPEDLQALPYLQHRPGSHRGIAR